MGLFVCFRFDYHVVAIRCVQDGLKYLTSLQYSFTPRVYDVHYYVNIAVEGEIERICVAKWFSNCTASSQWGLCVQVRKSTQLKSCSITTLAMVAWESEGKTVRDPKLPWPLFAHHRTVVCSSFV